MPDDWRVRAERLDAIAVHLAAEHVDAAAVRALNAARMPWAAWTVNDLATAERLFGFGAVAIITDRPDLWAGARTPAA